MRGSANADVLVEVAVESVGGARAAAAAGAHRLELCADLAAGGLSPSMGLVEAVLDAVELPVFVMVRPRAGDFLYDDSEFDVMLRDVEKAREAGARGIVSGALTAPGHVDAARLANLVAAARPLPLTFHRAFDVCADPGAAIETLAAAGVARILTSGQAASAPAGAAAIRSHVEAAGSRLVVVAGGGVRPGNVRSLVEATGVTEVHLSAGGFRDGGMSFRRPGVPMGSGAPPGEHVRWVTDGGVVAGVLAALRAP